MIADNASTDGTAGIAAALAAELPQRQRPALEQKGRGRALRAAWSASDADVVCYMDVDLSTDLRALLPLVGGLLAGHGEVAIGRGWPRVTGRRAAPSASSSRAPTTCSCAWFCVRGSPTPSAASRRCGADAAARLLPAIGIEGWFFDTELLVLAQRQGMRIHEVPGHWIDDPDSRVDIVQTALTDLRGRRAPAAGRPRWRGFSCIGALSTIAYALLYLGSARLARSSGARTRWRWR